MVPRPPAAPALPAPPALPTAERIPPRPAGALGGAEFARRTAAESGRRRQALAVRELVSGNLPHFLRQLKPVRLSHAPAGGGAPLEATVWVMPDYLAIGSDDDFLRIPLTYPSAVTVAARLGFVLPTRKIVDAVYEQAEVRLAPVPMTPGRRMRSTAYFVEHQKTIERQRGDRPLGLLVAGHKKDVVVTNRLFRTRGRIAIYGWHRAPGRPIQPLSTVHGGRYADYSHGLRLVHPEVLVAGEPRRLVDLLEDRASAPLFSYEGVIRGVGRLLDPRAVAEANP